MIKKLVLTVNEFNALLTALHMLAKQAVELCPDFNQFTNLKTRIKRDTKRHKYTILINDKEWKD
jgi:hypothetical protein